MCATFGAWGPKFDPQWHHILISTSLLSDCVALTGLKYPYPWSIDGERGVKGSHHRPQVYQLLLLPQVTARKIWLLYLYLLPFSTGPKGFRLLAKVGCRHIIMVDFFVKSYLCFQCDSLILVNRWLLLVLSCFQCQWLLLLFLLVMMKEMMQIDFEELVLPPSVNLVWFSLL